MFLLVLSFALYAYLFWSDSGQHSNLRRQAYFISTRYRHHLLPHVHNPLRCSSSAPASAEGGFFRSVRTSLWDIWFFPFQRQSLAISVPFRKLFGSSFTFRLNFVAPTWISLPASCHAQPFTFCDGICGALNFRPWTFKPIYCHFHRKNVLADS